MKRFPPIAAAVLTAATAQVAAAQLPGIPYGPVETGLAIHVSADYGKPDSDLGGGQAYGLTGGVGFSRFGITASVGGTEPDNINSEVAYGGRLGMRVFGGGLNPISVGAQVGVASVQFAGITSTRVVPGAFIKFSPPLFPIKPWAQYYYQAGDNVKEESRFVVGANFNLLLGFGFHGAYDWGNSGGLWGIGAHFTFGMP